MKLSVPLLHFITSLDTSKILDERKQVLQELIDYIREKQGKDQAIRLHFICTHNSRRSHLAQIWAQTMAYHVGLRNVDCYSGGTEATALYPMVAEVLSETGFSVSKLSDSANSVYCIKYGENEAPIIGFSKTLDHSFNPKSEFCAIMTCHSANEACPLVAGAEKRIPITYEDPKHFDQSALQAEKYFERSRQIATEMFYVFMEGRGE